MTAELDFTEAREMAAVLYRGLRQGAFGDVAPEAVLTANLAPLIERQVRERIAADIEAATYDLHLIGHPVDIRRALAAFRGRAARIARGGVS